MTCPLPHYWMCHIAIALLIAVVLWPFLGLDMGLVAGASVYTGRELTQWEESGVFDWKGLLAPIAACLTVLLVSKAL
jgi:hypothetical protein